MLLLPRRHTQILRPRYDITNGLLVWWLFYGQSAQDYSGNQRNGTISGAKVAAGPFGNTAREFDYDTNTISLASQLSNVRTISFWCKFKSPFASRNVFLNSGATNSVQTDGSSKWAIYDGTLRSFSAGPTAGIWQHNVFVYTGSGYDLYVNGAFIENKASNQVSIIQMGRSSPSGFSIYGSVSDVRLYSRSLSAGEVSALYAMSFEQDWLEPMTYAPPVTNNPRFINFPMLGM